MEEENKTTDEKLISIIQDQEIVIDSLKDKLNKHGQLEDEGACEDEI